MAQSRTNKLISFWKWSTIALTILVISLMVFKDRSTNTPPAPPIAPPPPIEKVVPKLPEPVKLNPSESLSTEALVAAGKILIYLTDDPKLNAMGRMPVGKGQCAFCHLFVEGQKSTRCPDLINVELRSHERIKEKRYQTFQAKYADIVEPDSRMKPRAKTGGAYLFESLYCPSCYVVEGFGEDGSHDFISKMPRVTEMPMSLNDYEIVAISSYLQAMDTPGDYSKVTAKADWERYFKKELRIGKDKRPHIERKDDLRRTALATDPPEIIIQKMGCFVCHKIPTVRISDKGLLGPVLTLKTTALERLNSPAYQDAFKAGLVHATTPKEYVIESILNPELFITPGYRDGDGMPTDYGGKLTVGAVRRLTDFLLTLDEHSDDALKKDGESGGAATSASKHN